MPRRNEVRISPNGEALAWHRPGFAGDGQPWLVIHEDPDVAGVETEWTYDANVECWTVLDHPSALLDEEGTGDGQPA